MEFQFYQAALIGGGLLNLMMALVLIGNSYAYSGFDTYRHSRLLTGLALAVFGVGFLLHYAFQWRTFWPAAATALSATYFHLGGMLLSWSHTSLLDAHYLTRRIVIRDIAILLFAITGYWLTAAASHLSPLIPTLVAPYLVNAQLFFGIFFLHITWLVYVFYRTYYRVSRRQSDEHTPTVVAFVRWMLRSCHLIILFGVGSILLTVLVPTAVWPYTVLLCVGMAVFIYIFYSLTEYGSKI